MTSALTLTTLRARVSQFLIDTTNVTFSANAVDAAIRQALGEYSIARPCSVVGTLTLAAGREQALTTFTGLLRVVRVWYPYTASDPEYPPEWIRFHLLWISGVPTLYMDTESAPAAAEVARIWYHKPQTLNLLDSATGTTFSADDDTLMELGAAGYAAAMRAVDIERQVTVPTGAARSVNDWGRERLSEFRYALAGGGSGRWRTS